MDSRRRGGPSDPPRAPQREGTGSLRLWGEEPLRDGTPPHGSVDPGYRPGVASPVPVPADATDPAVTSPLAIDVQVQLADPPTDPEIAAIWDRAFVSEEKAPPLVLGPDARPVSQIEDRNLPTIAIRTVDDAPRRPRRLTPVLVLVGLLLGAGGAVLAFQHLRSQQTTEALARALERARSDSVAANLESLEALEALSREVPDRPDVRDALAERTALFALRFDPSGPVRERTASLAATAGDTPGLIAARAVDALLRGDAARAEALLAPGLSSSTRTPALAYVRARARLATAQPDAAIQDLLWAESVVPEWPAPLALRVEAERLAGRLVDARETLADLRGHAAKSTELPVVATLVELDAVLLAPTNEALLAGDRRVEEVLAVLDSRARSPAARLRLAAARIALARGEAASALETLRALRGVLPDSPELVRVLAQAQSAAGDPEAALQTLAGSPAADLEATWTRAQVLLQLERPEAARRALEGLGAATTPDRAKLVEGLASFQSFDAARAVGELGQLDLASAGGLLRDEAALAWIEAQAETTTWDQVRTAVQKLGTHAARPCARAVLLAMFANERGAREGLTTATGAAPATCVARLQGRLALASGDAEAAVVHLRRAAAGGRPSDVIDLARATWRHQGANAAREVAQRALALAPTGPRALYPLVELLASLGAQSELPRAVSLAADPSTRAALLARGLRLSGDAAGAQAALAAAGDAPLVQLERAQLALERGDAAGAVTAAEAARAAPPAMAGEALSVRIRALVAAGRDAQADAVLKTELTQRMNRGNRQAVFRLRLLRAAIAIDRGDPASLRVAAADIDFTRLTLTIGSADPIVLAAALSAKQGQRSEAVRLYHQALAHDPTRRDAFTALDALGEAGEVDRALFARSWPEAAAAMQSR